MSKQGTSSTVSVNDRWKTNMNSTFKMQGFEQKFLWTIENINQVLLPNPLEEMCSPVFHIGIKGDCRFYLSITKDESDYIGFYVNLQTVSEQKMVVHFSIYIDGTFEKRKFFIHSVGVFDKNNGEWGRPNCMKREMLLDPAHGYVENDILIVHCIIQFSNDVDNVVHVKTPGNHRRFLEDFEDLLFDNKFSDVTLVVSGENFPVHRSILAQRCKYFENLFSTDKHVKQEKSIDIKNVTSDVFREILRFIYCGKVNDLHELVEELLVASETYYILDLRVLCEGELLKNLCTNNAVDFLVIADRYQLHSLKMHAFDAIGRNSIEIVKTEGFKKLCDSGNSRLLGEAFAKMSEIVNDKFEWVGNKRKRS